MLETDIQAYSVNTILADALATEVIRQAISIHGIDSIDKKPEGLLHCELGLLLLNKIQDVIRNVNTLIKIFKTIQHVKS